MKVGAKGGITKVGALYGRVSVDDAAQVEHGSLEQQKHMGLELVKNLSDKNGEKMQIAHILIEEKGLSGAKSHNRPKYQELLRLIITDRIDFIVAKEISRLSRSIKDFIYLMELCRQHEVALYIKGLDVDPTTSSGKMIFTIMGMLAEMERDMVVTRTRESLRSAAINNAKINGGCTPLGFDRHPQSKGFYVVNKTEMEHVKYLMEFFSETGSMKQTLDEAKLKAIQNKNGKPLNYSSLGRMVKNEKYIGIMRVQMGGKLEPRVVNLTHGCPIPVPLFEKVQEKLKSVEISRFKNRVGTRIYLLSSLLRFEDDSIMSGSSGIGRNKDRYHYYRAKGHDITLDASALEKAIFEKFRLSFECDAELEKCVTQVDSDKMNEMDLMDTQIRSVQSQIREIKKQGDELAKLLTSGASSTTQGWLDERIKALQNQAEDFNSKLTRLERDRESLASTKVDRKKVRSILARAFAALELATPAKQRGLLREVFKEIKVFRNNRVQIRWAVPAHLDLPAVTKTGGGCNGLSSLKNGGASNLEPNQSIPPPEVHLYLPFRSRPAYRDHEFLHQKYVLEGRSVAQIASEIGSSKEAVRKGLFRVGIKPRPPCESHGHPAQPRFGTQIAKGRVVPHLGELRISKLVYQYHLDGFSLRKIAGLLNQQKIPTKTRCETWHPQMVSRILFQEAKSN